MVKKIISGGQTGVDRAALDFAIKFDLPHGGWIVKGRRAEDGVLPEKYMLQEIPESSYPRRTLKNVVESDGTLLISRGPLTGGSDYTRKMAISRDRPYLHIDLSQTSAFQAAEKIRNWLMAEKIEILNVAGPRRSKDPKIYSAVLDLLETAFFLEIIDTNMPGAAGASFESSGKSKLPETVDEAVEILIPGMSFADRTKIANMPSAKIKELSETLREEIVSRFALGEENAALMSSCRQYRDFGNGDEQTEAVEAILLRLGDRLRRKRNVLKVVKS
jgi:hypothetical protein